MMKALFVSSVLMVAVGAVAAGPIIPGKLHRLEIKGGDAEIKVEPTDVIELRIPNPALAKKVHDVDVKVEGDAIFGGAANTSEPKLVGSDRISIFIGLTPAPKASAVVYSYKDGSGTEHKGKVTIHVIK